MSQLRVGDRVLTQRGRYERVYSFGHRQPHKTAEFLLLLPSGLELSKDHMVLAHDRGFIPASMIKTGDVVMVVGSGDEDNDNSNNNNNQRRETVMEIRTVYRTGIYAPFTPSGTISVNGVLVSNYISLQNSDRLTLGTTTSSSFTMKLPFFTYQWLSHTLQVPHRIWCHWLGMSDSNNPQTGFSTWTEPPYRFIMWWLHQESMLCGGLLLIPIISLLIVFFLLDQTILLLSSLMVNSPSHLIVVAAMIVSAIYLFRRRSSVKQMSLHEKKKQKQK
mmetsp:Transcript_31572/g.44816  ORF Transcript_31572/g.44816 Transcript_31572/m.44816 type:complete len:275 (-) Transcript_31572:178-1002(-)